MKETMLTNILEEEKILKNIISIIFIIINIFVDIFYKIIDARIK